MAFRSAYNRVVDKNRTDGNAVRWWPSLGFDKHERESALLAAVASGRLGHSTVAGLLPPPDNIEISQEVLKLSQKLMQK